MTHAWSLKFATTMIVCLRHVCDKYQGTWSARKIEGRDWFIAREVASAAKIFYPWYYMDSAKNAMACNLWYSREGSIYYDKVAKQRIIATFASITPQETGNTYKSFIAKLHSCQWWLLITSNTSELYIFGYCSEWYIMHVHEGAYNF